MNTERSWLSVSHLRVEGGAEDTNLPLCGHLERDGNWIRDFVGNFARVSKEDYHEF